MAQTRRFRWWGDPTADTEPDAGDVLVFHDQRRDRDWYLIVNHAAPVRGRSPHDLWLLVERLDLGPDGSIPAELLNRLSAGADFYPAELRRRATR